MEIKLIRIAKMPAYTIGRVYVDGEYFCDSLEDKDRGLTQKMTLQQIKALKVYGETAIPTGTYRITYTYSPKFKRNLPLVNDVKGFDGIRVHPLNTAAESEGCIGLGEKKVNGKIINSRVWCERLNEKILAAIGKKEEIILVVQ